MELILKLLSYVSAYIPLFIVIYTFRSRKHHLWVYVLFGGLAEVISAIIKFGFKMPMDGVANIYLIGELIAYTYFFKDQLLPKMNLKVYALGIMCWIFLLAMVTYESFWNSMNMMAIALNCFIFISFSLLVYRKMLLDQLYVKISENPNFWFNTGIFIYAAGGCLFFLLLDQVVKEDTQFLIALWLTFYCVINLLRYAFIGIGLNRLGRNERI